MRRKLHKSKINTSHCPEVLHGSRIGLTGQAARTKWWKMSRRMPAIPAIHTKPKSAFSSRYYIAYRALNEYQQLYSDASNVAYIGLDELKHSCGIIQRQKIDIFRRKSFNRDELKVGFCWDQKEREWPLFQSRVTKERYLCRIGGYIYTSGRWWGPVTCCSRSGYIYIYIYMPKSLFAPATTNRPLLLMDHGWEDGGRLASWGAIIAIWKWSWFLQTNRVNIWWPSMDNIPWWLTLSTKTGFYVCTVNTWMIQTRKIGHVRIHSSRTGQS